MSNDKFYIGQNAASFETAPALEAYTGVRLWYDDEHFYFAGDDSGRVLEQDQPWATQAMADAVLASIAGFKYQPFEAGTALLDMEAELGDGVTIGGIYAPLASINTVFNAMCASDISAPFEEEVDHEYPYQTKQQRELARRVTLGRQYYGTRITRQNGLEVVKTTEDGTETARVRLNSDVLAFYDASGSEALYFDAEAGRYRFRGDVEITGGTMNVNNNFIVDEYGNLTMNGSINFSGGAITWGANGPPKGDKGDKGDTGPAGPAGPPGADGSDGDPEEYLRSIGITKITSAGVSAPYIEGGQIWGADIFGGAFYDLNKNARLEIDDRAYGGIAGPVMRYYNQQSNHEAFTVWSFGVECWLGLCGGFSWVCRDEIDTDYEGNPASVIYAIGTHVFDGKVKFTDRCEVTGLRATWG